MLLDSQLLKHFKIKKTIEKKHKTAQKTKNTNSKDKNKTKTKMAKKTNPNGNRKEESSISCPLQRPGQ